MFELAKEAHLYVSTKKRYDDTRSDRAEDVDFKITKDLFIDITVVNPRAVSSWLRPQESC